MSMLGQLGAGLAKTRDGLLGTIQRLLPGSRKLTPELCETLEGALLAADVRVAAPTALMVAVRGVVRDSGRGDADSLGPVLQPARSEALQTAAQPETDRHAPRVNVLAGAHGLR